MHEGVLGTCCSDLTSTADVENLWSESKQRTEDGRHVV